MLSVSVNGYRAWKRGGTPGRARLTDPQLLTLIRTVHAAVKGAYDSPRMTEEIRERGFPKWWLADQAAHDDGSHDRRADDGLVPSSSCTERAVPFG